MNERNKKTELLGNAPIPKALLALGLPTMIGMMVNALYNLVDAYFVSGLGTSQNGAIAVAFPLGQIIVGLGLLFGNGAASYISRLLGKGEKDTANKVANTALFSSIFVGTAIIILTVIFLNPILKLLGATESILPYAVTYTSIYIISCIFNVFNVTMNNIVTSEGAAKTTMYALLSGAVLNIILDPILIYTFNLEIAGAAIATAISQMVSTCVYLYYILSKKSNFTFNIKDYSLSKDIMAEIFKIGIPTLVFQLLTSLSIALISAIAKTNGYGDSVIAGMGDVTRIVSMGSLMVFGFIKGFQPISGYNYGAKKYERLYETIKTTIIWSTVFCVIFGSTVAIFSSGIMSGFTKDDMELINVGRKALIANGLSFFIFGFYTVYSSLFLALGKGKEGFIIGALRQGLCFLPVILVLPLIFGLDGIIYSQPLADILSGAVTVFMASRLRKELNKEKENYLINEI
ncbi:MATE family efflux transporter [Anaerofustis stercorihominis]|uniref:MATE family efflux transporter n=1 Tax=Anaerofustis stercorihominis TaxID=214853 RepID=UPI00214CDF88|nr:MATE family efflux transporter [Anaerofustis stercorihominis]MCR2033322.1 MATE family efflux transporter [Anaerofustis stercorihominis]